MGTTLGDGRLIPLRIKHTFPPPHVCISCYWEERYKASQQINKALRRELLKFHIVSKGSSKKAESSPRERDDDHDVPDVLDEMSGMGKIKLDD